MLHVNGGHVHARSEHVFVVAHEKQSSSIFCSLDATGRITALRRSEFQLT